MPLPDLSQLPCETPEFVNLRQAVLWVAFDLRPVPEDLEVGLARSSVNAKGDFSDSQWNNINDAKGAIFLYLRTGRLNARGFNQKTDEFEEYDEYRFIRSKTELYKCEISDVDFDRNKITITTFNASKSATENICVYVNIYTDDLLRAFPLHTGTYQGNQTSDATNQQSHAVSEKEKIKSGDKEQFNQADLLALLAVVIGEKGCHPRSGAEAGKWVQEAYSLIHGDGKAPELTTVKAKVGQPYNRAKRAYDLAQGGEQN